MQAMSHSAVGHPRTSIAARLFHLAVLLWLGLMGLASAQAQTIVPGKIPGQFGVSPSGAATYSIPIQVPPGIAGMQPKLSLEYNSQGGNGIMGMGWNLAGLSAITRCPQTKAQDGPNAIGGIRYDWNDRYCMDGQRLMLVDYPRGDSVTYESGLGSRYRTEIESFSEITPIGVQGNGPASFSVRTKAGLTMEYGNPGITAASANARIEAQGSSTVRHWLVNKITDIKGNTMNFTYGEDNASGEYVAATITYAGNTVQFVYEPTPRPDTLVGYQAGSKITASLRLNSISTFTGAATTTVTKLQYTQTADNQRSILTTVQTCDGAASSCIAPLQVSWLGHGLSNYAAHSRFSASLPDTFFTGSAGGVNMGTQMADLNGDGLPDIVQLYYPTNGDYGNVPQRRVYLNTGVGFAYDANYSASLPGMWFRVGSVDSGTQLADINGDGLPDLVQLYFPTNGDYGNVPQRWVYLNNGTGFVYSASFSASLPDTFFAGSTSFAGSGWGVSMGTQLADLNGDGLPDLVQLYFPSNGDYGNLPQRRVYLNTGASFAYDANYSASLPDTYFAGSAVGVNGYRAVPFVPPKGRNMGTQLADVNGDGLPDLVQLYFPTNGDYGNVPQRRIYLNSGKGFVYSASFSASLPDTFFTGSAGGVSMGTQMADLNGDGLPDIVQLYYPTNGDYGNVPQKRVYLNTGAGFAYDANYSVSLPGMWFRVGSADSGTQLADINGDGLPDLIQLYFPTNGDYGNVPQKWVYLNNGTSFVYSASFSTNLPDTYFAGSTGGVNLGTQLADLDGDGLPDLIQLYFPTNGDYGNAPQRRVYLNNGSRLLVTSLKQGNASISTGTALTYRSLSGNSAGYVKDATSVYPKIDLQIPLHVVSHVANSNGVSGVNTTQYSYGGLKAEQGTGRGMLGFRWMKSLEVATNIETLAEYYQDFPYTGQVYQATTQKAGYNSVGECTFFGGGLIQVCAPGSYVSPVMLKRSTSNPGCKIPQNGAACSAAPGNRYFIYTANSTEESWDLNGKAFPTLRTEYDYQPATGDGTRIWGDPTKITVTNGGDGSSKVTENTYKDADTTNWILGRLSKAKVTSTSPVASTGVGILAGGLIVGNAPPTPPSPAQLQAAKAVLPAIRSLLLED
jgi:Salmonella virulence plasmid 65kDa B protein/FG-GAP-like repeat